MSDNVDNPSHYNAGGIETIEGIKAALGDGFLWYCLGNVLKYVWRCRHKGKLVEDLRKAAKYLEWAIEAAEGSCSVVQDSSTNPLETPNSSKWIPKVGDRVWVNCPGRVADGEIGVVIEGDAGRYAVRIDKMELTSFNLEAKQLELIEAAP